MSVPYLISGLLPLFIIIVLLGAALYFVKKYGFKFKIKNPSGIEIKTLASQMIAPKKYVSVVSVQNQLLILGVSDHSITLLKELSSPGEKPKTNNTALEENADFAAMLKKNLGML